MFNHIHAVVEGLYRKDMRDYPEDALREALLNAIIHRDYSFSASTLISVFDDRIEFVSIGGLPKGITINDIMLGLSIPRNPNLSAIFYRLRLIEAYGTGIPKIMRSYDNNPKKPVIETSDNGFKIVLPNRNTSTSTLDRADFTNNEKVLLRLLHKENAVQRRDVETALQISQAAAGRLLKELTGKGLVMTTGRGKNTEYRLARAGG
jgi:ATP-dependent DNA helicase RecG